MKTFLIVVIVGMTAAASIGAIPNFYDGFESYAENQQFISVTNGWQASGPEAYVSGSGGYTNSKAAYVGAPVALTNTLNTADPSLKVWTDFRAKPMLGEETPNPPTNATSFLCYFNRSGVMLVATPTGGWYACTNDFQGNSVAAATTNDYVHLSVYQDFSTSNQAVFLNEKLILQDFGFVGTAGSYARFVTENTGNSNNNCWLDDVRVSTNYDAATLTNDVNADGLADAYELQQYGHARITLYVNGGGTPSYASIQAAINASDSRDIISVTTAPGSEDLTITHNLFFEGANINVDSLTITADAAVEFAQSVNCGTLSLTGQMAMASGASLTSSTATVEGSLSVSTNGSFVVTNLAVGTLGLVSFTTNATLEAITAGVTLSGPWTISNTWGTALVGMPLPFGDNFNAYGENTAMTALKFLGWDASTNTVKVQSDVAKSGRAVIVPDDTVLSNSISDASTKIWTDFYLKPALGSAPTVQPAGSFVAYVNGNGYLVVATNGGGWVVCSNQLGNVLATPLQSNVFARVSICQNLSAGAQKFAVFIDGNLLAQGLTPPVGLTLYSGFVMKSQHVTAYVDDVLISTAIPSGLTNDLDHNGFVDAYEINNFGLTSDFLPHGAIYTIR